METKIDLFKERYAYNIDFGKNKTFLDLGGGHKIHPKATHVIDFKDHNQQRGDRDLQKVEKVKYYYEGAPDAFAKIPNKYFDFIYSSHCLEHIKELRETLNEITRTCMRGLFTFPGSDFDFMMAKSHFGHINAFRERRESILWCRKNFWFDELAEIFENRVYLPEGCDSPLEAKYRYLWECRYYWEDEPDFIQVDPEDIYPQMKYHHD